MAENVKVKRFIENNERFKKEYGYEVEGVQMVKDSDSVDPWYGMTAHFITPKQVEQLLKGKVIYFDDGEYAHLVYMKEEENVKKPRRKTNDSGTGKTTGSKRRNDK